MKQCLYAGIIILLFFANAGANPDILREMADKANSAYETRDYAGAIELYSAIIHRGVINGYVAYNLGNAYFKNGQTGRAVLWYERALRLIPRDRDLRFNSVLMDRITGAEEEGFITHLLIRFDRLMTLNELTALILAVHLGLIVCLFFVITIKTVIARRISAGLAAAYAVMFLWWWVKVDREIRSEYGVVVVSQSEVRNGPGDDFTVGFIVPEGRKVLFIRRKDGWREVGVRERGLKGWIKEEEVDKI